MRVDSYTQTPASKGVAHKALSVLMALVLALGLMPMPKQAYAAEMQAASIIPMTVDDTLVLAAGTHQGAGKTELTCETGDNSVTLYAQIQDFATGGTSYVSGAYDAYGSGFTQDMCAGFKVTWYKGSVGASNVMEEQQLEWNSISSKPKWTTDFQKGAALYEAADGVYKFYAVATYGSQTSEPLEFTVTKGDVPDPETSKQNLTIEVTPENIADAASIDVRQDSETGTKISKYFMGYYELQKGHSYYITVSYTGYATKKVTYTVDDDAADENTLAVELTAAAATSAVFTFVASNDGVDFSDYNNAWVKVYKGANPTNDDMLISESSGWNQYKLEFGETYTVIARDNAEKYAQYRETFTPNAETSTTQTITLQSATDDPTPAKHAITGVKADAGVTGLSFKVDGDYADEAAEGSTVTIFPVVEYERMLGAVSVVDADGAAITPTLGTLAENGGKYYFTMPAKAVTVTVSSKGYTLSAAQGVQGARSRSSAAPACSTRPSSSRATRSGSPSRPTRASPTSPTASRSPTPRAASSTTGPA